MAEPDLSQRVAEFMDELLDYVPDWAINRHGLRDDQTALNDAVVAGSTTTMELVAALKPLMGTIDFYIGPNARTAVSHESKQSYERLRLTLARAAGEPCHRCKDTGIDQEWLRADGSTRPCPLRKEPAHRIELPPEVVAYMRERCSAAMIEDKEADVLARCPSRRS